MFCHSDVRKFVLPVIRMELAKLPEVHSIDLEYFKAFAERISHFLTSLPPATSRVLGGCTQIESALYLILLLFTISYFLLVLVSPHAENSGSNSSLIRNVSFRRTHGRFRHIVNELAVDGTHATTSFL